MTIDKNTLVRTIADVLYKKETITMEEKLARVFDIPKPAMRIFDSKSNKIFVGLRERCVTPRLCAYSSPLAISIPISKA